jgi:hypothetical protein
MRVKVLTKFKDKHTGEIHEAGKVMTVSKERFAEILETDKLVEEVKEAKEKKEKKEEE